MNTREIRKEKTRQKIIKTTSELIRKGGIEKLSLRQVAKKMNYSPSGMYEYFTSKEALIDAVLEKGLKAMSKYLKRVPSELSWKKKLVELGFAYLDFAFTEPEVYFLVYTKLHSKRRAVTDEVNKDSPYYYYFNAIRQGVDIGEFNLQDDHTLDTVTFAFWSLLHGMVMLELTHLKGFDADFKKYHSLNLEAMVRGFLS